MTLEQILGRFRGVRPTGSTAWRALCPAHADSDPSLGIKLVGEKVLLHCRAGCLKEAVLSAAGLTFRDLRLDAGLDSLRGGLRPSTSGRAPLKLATFADAKKLSVDFLREMGVIEQPRGLQITYRLRDGSMAPRQRLRTAVTAKEGSSWLGGKGRPLVPYGLDRLDDAVELGELLLVEGESDTLTAWFHNIPCLGIPGAAMASLLQSDALKGIERVGIVKEPGHGGDSFVAGLAARLSTLSWQGEARVITFDGVKDLNDLHRTAGDRFADEFARAKAAAVPLRIAVDHEDNHQTNVVPVGEGPAPYTFTPAVGPGHFLADYIGYGASRTDAAHELHEAGGLVLLAAATPNVRAMLSPYPGGLATNLYVLVVGDSTLSRKSTAKDIARDLHDAVIPNGALPDLTSPEAFIEQIAKRPGDSSTWFVDEVGDLLDKLHHAKYMAGMRGLLLTVYAGHDYRYGRHSKRTKGGSSVDDEDLIRQPHLSVLGATTPGIFDVLTGADVRSGLLPRFAIVMPTGKPARRPFYGSGAWDERLREPLTAALHRLYVWACSTARGVTFAPDVLETLDTFAARLEREAGGLDEAGRPMLHRLAPMCLKVAMLIAAGRPETPEREGLVVSAADADSAIVIAERWRAGAIAFASRIGETEFEKQIERCLRVVRTKRRVGRQVVARAVHLPKRTLDDIEATLVDRGLLGVERTEVKGRPTLTTWEWQGA